MSVFSTIIVTFFFIVFKKDYTENKYQINTPSTNFVFGDINETIKIIKQFTASSNNAYRGRRTNSAEAKYYFLVQSNMD